MARQADGLIPPAIGRDPIVGIVALVAALLTFYIVRVTNGDAARCDVHPSLTSSNRAAIKTNAATPAPKRIQPKAIIPGMGK